MDGDIFGAVTRLGRQAAEAVARALNGGQWDPFLAERCLEIIVKEAEGIPSLASVLSELRGLEDSPLLARALRDQVIDRIGALVRAARGTILDVILKSAAEKCILLGEYSGAQVLERFCAVVLERAILCGQGGFLELAEGGPARLGEAQAILAEVVVAGATVLRTRPDAKLLQLTRHSARLTSESNLLEGGDE